MHVRLLTDAEAFSALQPAWDRLHAQCAPGDAFLSHAWFDAAWQWKRAHASLYVLCCVRTDGTLAGVAPLARCEAARAPLPHRALEWLSVPDTQRCDVLAAPADRNAVIAALAAEIARRAADWDVARLQYLAADSLAVRALAPALRDARIDIVETAAGANPWIALDTGWPNYFASRSRRLKKAIHLAANRLAKAGRVDVEWLAPGSGEASDVARAIDTITRISSRSWKTSTGNSLDNPGPQAFVRRLAENAHRRGWLSVWNLALDGQPVAMELQIACDGAVYALRSDFDAALDELSPGSHLARCMLERLFDAGFTRYHMGPGDNPYKLRWAEGSDPVLALAGYSRSLRGRALAAWDLALKPVARRVRDAWRRRSAEAPAAPMPER
jgi:CelD/BcsL family acetyltransferase involved in cellulose biosynthesis